MHKIIIPIIILYPVYSQLGKSYLQPLILVLYHKSLIRFIKKYEVNFLIEPFLNYVKLLLMKKGNQVGQL
jgi:hypothetical protein